MTRTFLRTISFFLSFVSAVLSHSPLQKPLATLNRNISTELFNELEELSRIVDISYCIGLTGPGIQKPFLCASRCQDFDSFELVTTWNTGQLMSDSCGYIALSHAPAKPRIVVAFRGTYSVTNTIIDLSTVPQEYVPYPRDEDEQDAEAEGLPKSSSIADKECVDCMVHSGFMTSWRHTRPTILPHLDELVQNYPGYELTLVGHSLGGAVAALASLEFEARGWAPKVTTFGEPRIGNKGLVNYLDQIFSNGSSNSITGRYRRVTHIDDPVPLLPLTEWGYQMHAGEVYISKAALSPEVGDVLYCHGDQDPECIFGAEVNIPNLPKILNKLDIENLKDWWKDAQNTIAIPARYRLWQLFFAHRDYFWRLGLCLPDLD